MENADILNTVEDAHRNEEKAIQEVAFILSMQRNLQFFALQLECLSDHLKVVSTIVKTEPHRRGGVSHDGITTSPFTPTRCLGSIHFMHAPGRGACAENHMGQCYHIINLDTHQSLDPGRLHDRPASRDVGDH